MVQLSWHFHGVTLRILFTDYGSDIDKPKKPKHPTKVLNRKHTPAVIKVPHKLIKCKKGKRVWLIYRDYLIGLNERLAVVGCPYLGRTDMFRRGDGH